jgi:hypothetical protein
MPRWPYPAIALALLGLSYLCLAAMPVLIASVNGGRNAYMLEIHELLTVLIVATPLSLMSSVGFALAGIRARRSPKLCMLIAALAVLSGVVVLLVF